MTENGLSITQNICPYTLNSLHAVVTIFLARQDGSFDGLN
jgi:hypothetical protein